MIPTYNNATNLAPLLEALGDQTLAQDEYEVVVVDDCSTDDTAAVLRRLGDQLELPARYLRTEVNSGGPSTPRNLGWRSAAAPVVAFLDDDCIPDEEWLSEAAAAMEAHPEWGVCQGRTIVPPGVDVSRASRWTVVRAIEGPTPHFEATNIFYRRDALEATGGFDETISWWGEDTDLGWRVVEAGWQRGFAAGAVVDHEVVDRGWRWHVKFGWLDHRLVEVAAQHPQLRGEGFWRPWAVNQADAYFALALASSAAALKWKPAVVGAIPYLVTRRPPFRRDGVNTRTVLEGLQTVVVDSVRFAGHIKGSLSARIFVL